MHTSVHVVWPGAEEIQLDALAHCLSEEYHLKDIFIEKNECSLVDKDVIVIQWSRSDTSDIVVGNYARGFRDGAFPPPYPIARLRKSEVHCETP